jgi:hypothetical protein
VSTLPKAFLQDLFFSLAALGEALDFWNQSISDLGLAAYKTK